MVQGTQTSLKQVLLAVQQTPLVLQEVQVAVEQTPVVLDQIHVAMTQIPVDLEQNLKAIIKEVITETLQPNLTAIVKDVVTEVLTAQRTKGPFGLTGWQLHIVVQQLAEAIIHFSAATYSAAIRIMGTFGADCVRGGHDTAEGLRHAAALAGSRGTGGRPAWCWQRRRAWCCNQGASSHTSSVNDIQTSLQHICNKAG